jgi:hypothetical protein
LRSMMSGKARSYPRGSRIAIKMEPKPAGMFQGYMNNEEENRKVVVKWVLLHR